MMTMIYWGYPRADHLVVGELGVQIEVVRLPAAALLQVDVAVVWVLCGGAAAGAVVLAQRVVAVIQQVVVHIVVPATCQH